MRNRYAVGFTVKAFVALSFLAVTWKSTEVSRAYVSAVAHTANRLISAGGGVGQLSLHGKEFVFRGVHAGRSVRVSSSAGSITANIILLAALFAASPIRPCRRLYWSFVSAALGGMFVLHVITVLVYVKHGLLKIPHDPGRWDDAVQAYVGSYSYVGLFLFVVLAWCPYILLYAARERRMRSHPRDEASSNRAAARPLPQRRA